jgi:hypothetical protein
MNVCAVWEGVNEAKDAKSTLSILKGSCDRTRDISCSLASSAVHPMAPVWWLDRMQVPGASGAEQYSSVLFVEHNGYSETDAPKAQTLSAPRIETQPAPLSTLLPLQSLLL